VTYEERVPDRVLRFSLYRPPCWRTNIGTQHGLSLAMRIEIRNLAGGREGGGKRERKEEMQGGANACAREIEIESARGELEEEVGGGTIT
jgi:hypothetical protein